MQYWTPSSFTNFVDEHFYSFASKRISSHLSNLKSPFRHPSAGPAYGDTPSYSVEIDSFVVVYSLPYGSYLRYAALVPGNDGSDFPECRYNDASAPLECNCVSPGQTEPARDVV